MGIEYIDKKPLVIVGAGEFGEIAYEYFTFDSNYEIVAFAVEREYRTIEELKDLPVVDFESINVIYPPDIYEVFVAITYVKLNRVRRRIYRTCKKMGYRCASYISSHSFVWNNVTIGENVFIFEDNTIQYHSQIGNNVVLWSGNHIGHRSVIEDDTWITSHDVISGFCHIGKGCFLGVNATLGDNVCVADDVVLGAGAVTIKNLDKRGGVYIGTPAKLLEDRTSYTQFDLTEKEI